MSVVVTGTAGFIGRHVVATLNDRGHHVVGIDRRTWTPAPLEHALVADLLDDDPAIPDALRDADGIVHLAGRPGVRDTYPDVERLRRRDNVLAGEVVLRHAPLTTPLVVASSSSVYGGTTGRACHEDDPPRPAGGYARSKVELERRCRLRREAGGAVAVARPFTVAGEGQRPDMALARWIADARAGRPLTIIGSRDRTRDLTDVRDVAEGLVRMLERAVTGTVNLGTGTGRSLGELTRAVADALAVPVETRTVPAAAVEPAATLADTRRCARLLGFVPSTDLASLVTRQIAAVPATALLAEAV